MNGIELLQVLMDIFSDVDLVKILTGEEEN